MKETYRYSSKNGSFKIVDGILHYEKVIDGFALGIEAIDAMTEYHNIKKNREERLAKIEYLEKDI